MDKPQLYIVHGDDLTEGERCDDCGQDDQFTWNIYGVSLWGVSTMGVATACSECTDMDAMNDKIMNEIRLQTGSL